MPFISLSTGSVHYFESGQGIPLILLHANPGDCQDFKAIIPILAKQWRVFALDWPGYGQSSPPAQVEKIGVLFFYQVLREFINTLKLPPAFLIGNSLGGNAAARLAINDPDLVRALVLVAPGGFTAPDFVSRIFCKLQGSNFSLSPLRFASLYLKFRTETTRAMLQRASTTQASIPQLALNRVIWRNFATAENDLRSSAHKITAPTLLLFGKYDPVISAARDGKTAEAIIDGAKLVVLPCGHASFAEVPDLFLAEVQPFLDAVQPQSR